MSTKLMTMRRLRECTALLAVVAVSVMSMACQQADWDDPEYIAEALQEGTTGEKFRAIEEMSDVSEEERDIVAGPAATAYIEGDESVKNEVMRTIIQWRHPAAEEAYVEEMAENHAGYADDAAQIVGNLGLEDTVPTMLEAFDETSDYERKAGILRGLAGVPDERALDRALEMLELDVDNFPIAVHRASCKFIGSLAAENPDAITEEVRDRLAYARMLMGADGRTVDESCGLAIQKVGHSMVPHLKELFHEEHEEVQGLLLKYDDPYGGEHFPQNEAKVKAAEHLSAMRAPGAVQLYIDEIETEVEEPDLQGDSLKNWRANESKVLNEMIKGLGDIGDPAARPVLEEILGREAFEDSPIVDPVVNFQMIQDSARSLARLGDREARPALLEASTADVLPGMQTRFEATAAQGQPVSPVERFRTQWISAQAYVYLAEADDRSDFQEVVEEYEFDEEALEEEFTEREETLQTRLEERQELLEGDQELEEERAEQFKEEVEMIQEDLDNLDDEQESVKEGRVELQEKFESFLAAFDVMDECGDIEAPAEQADCFGGYLDSDEEHARDKAAMELSRMQPSAAGPIIAEHLDTSDLEFRETLTFAAYRVPTDELVDRIDEILEAESGEDDSEYETDHYRLKMLRAWLQNQGQGDVVTQ